MLSGSSMRHTRVTWNKFEITGIENILQAVVVLILFPMLKKLNLLPET